MTSTDTGTDTSTDTAASADAFAEQIFSQVIAAQQIQAIHLGDRLGWYRALADGDGLTSVELATRTATAERYAREWLEHQAVWGVLSVDDVTREPIERRFRLPAAHAEVLTAELSPRYMAPFARLTAGLGKHLDALLHAYRTGGGVSWDELGEDAREAQGAANRSLFLTELGTEHLPRIEAVHDALVAGGRVADIGCGFGWSSIGMALAYPDATVDGFDVDGPSITAARRHADEAGVGDRVRFHLVDAGELPGEGSYDLVSAFECIHDMPDPVSVLTAMRRLAAADGTVLVMDERVGETFTAPGDDVERFMYGFSLTCCLPDGLSAQRSVGTGTVMRPPTLEGYARAAGFDGIDVLPIEHDFFRFYRLRLPPS